MNWGLLECFKMKKFTLKFVAAFLLIFSSLFATPFAQTALAVPPGDALESINTENPDTSDSETSSEDTSTNGEAENTESSSSDNTEESKTNTETPSIEDLEDEFGVPLRPHITLATEQEDVCQGQAGSTSWLLCPVLNTVSNLVDNLYNYLSSLLTMSPITTDDNSPVFQVWQRVRDITNIVFIILILVVIFSQVTGFGIDNYGIKRVLPRIIIAAILVNLSYLISAVAVDISNIIGSNITQIFNEIQNDAGISGDLLNQISWTHLFRDLSVGAVTGITVAIASEGLGAIFWMAVIGLICGALSILIGFITVALRQAVVLLLVMIAPLAVVSYLLPNTEKWFEKWRQTFMQMLVFYPMFSFLFGACKLAGWTIIASGSDADSPFLVLIGMIIQVAPLFLGASLLKMSNTVLGAVSSGLQRLTDPFRGSITRWGDAKVAESRQRYREHNFVVTGARLRNYLAYRQKVRELHTQDLTEINEGRATTRALDFITSSKGLDARGRARWRQRPSRYTRIAKTASLQKTLTETAQQNRDNTLSEYGDVFKGAAAKQLSTAHANAYLDSMTQQFRAENIAQSDQSYLLNSYLNAAKDQKRAPYEYNRLIGGATGRMGHMGETTIMGQVIMRSAEIEARRRREAGIVITKFGVNKGAYRGMLLDKARINDDGIEEDENGVEIEDSQYRYKPGMENRHREWGQYIWVDPNNNVEKTRAEYDALSASEQKKYSKVRYMDIRDDAGDVIQRIYDDDAGYMKEMLRNDIMIGDPINRRYAAEIGNKRYDNNYDAVAARYQHLDRTGMLRRYHSTIAAALIEAGYSEHAAEFTQMLKAQIDNGYVGSVGQRNIAGIESLLKAAKAGKIMQNDAVIIKDWEKILNCVNSTTPGERFEDYFPDADIALYQNVNGFALKGLRKAVDVDGNYYWQTIDRNDPNITLEDKKNFIKHKLLPELKSKLIGVMNRPLSQQVLDNQKPDSTAAYLNMANSIMRSGERNLDDSIPFEERDNPNFNILDSKNPRVIQNNINEGMQAIRERTMRRVANSDVPLGHSAARFNDWLFNKNQKEDKTEVYNSSDSIIKEIENTFDSIENINVIGNNILGIFANHPDLRSHLETARSIVESYLGNGSVDSPEDVIDQTAHPNQNNTPENREAMRSEILNLAYLALNR